MLKRVLAVVFCVQMVVSASNISIKYNGIRKAFERSESVVLEYQVSGDYKDGQCSVVLDIDGVVKQANPLNNNERVLFRFDAEILKPGIYNADVSVVSDDKKVASCDTEIMISNMWNPERTRVWLWAHHKFGSVVYNDSPQAKEMLKWYVDKGFNSFVPGGGVGAKTNYGGFDEGKLALFDYGLYNGLEMGISAHRSCFFELEDDALNFKIGKKWLQGTDMIANPFNQKVAMMQDEMNIEMMKIIQHFPGVKICYLESEFEDYLPPRVPLSEQFYRYEYPQTTPHEFLKPGVIADTDEKYIAHLHRFQWGDGIVYMNENVARVVKNYRPDMLVFSDPLRRTLVRERMQGLDGISTWTYTNPDPKYMLYIELLKNYADAIDKKVFHTITLFNRRGSIAPADKWDTVMGPDRLVETSWINLSRNTGSLCYYIGSASDPLSEETVTLFSGSETQSTAAHYPYQKYPQTFEALKKFNENVVQPYGPMISHLKDMKRKTAVLASESAFQYRDGTHVASWYQGYYVMDFYALLAMNQIPADIIFDDDIRRGKLAEYDDLFLIRCDTLTESVHDGIIDYQKSGGRVYADNYLRAPIDGIERFDFEFGYRRRVNVGALKDSELFAGGGDTITEIMSKVESTEGVTAENDQKIMEQYASILNAAVGDTVHRQIKCSSLNVVSNMLDYGDTKYLFLINDKRTYSDRFGDCEECKGMLDKFVEQDVEIELVDGTDAKYAFDMLSGKMLTIKGGKFNVRLDDTGGRIIAIGSQKLAHLNINIPSKVKRGGKVNISVAVLDEKKNSFNGVVPVILKLTDPAGDESIADYYAVTDGFRAISFTPALNDVKGKWTVQIKELFTGKTTTKKFTVD